MKTFDANLRAAHEGGIRFLRTELQTAFTLARLAGRTHSPKQRRRNLANSRRAYEALTHFRQKAHLTQEETKEIDAGMAKLKQILQSLGQKM